MNETTVIKHNSVKHDSFIDTVIYIWERESCNLPIPDEGG